MSNCFLFSRDNQAKHFCIVQNHASQNRADSNCGRHRPPLHDSYQDGDKAQYGISFISEPLSICPTTVTGLFLLSHLAFTLTLVLRYHNDQPVPPLCQSSRFTLDTLYRNASRCWPTDFPAALNRRTLRSGRQENQVTGDQHQTRAFYTADAFNTTGARSWAQRSIRKHVLHM